MRRIAGSREEAVAAAETLAAEAPTGPAGAAWAALSVTGGDGAFSETCGRVREALAGSGVELIGVSDDRAPDAGSSPAATAPLSVEDFRAVSPERLAADRLAEPDLRLSEAERDALLDLVREVL